MQNKDDPILPTTIRVSTATRQRLVDLCKKNESYDDKINEILDRLEELGHGKDC